MSRMNFDKITPRSTEKTVGSPALTKSAHEALKFDVILVPDQSMSAAAPNRMNSLYIRLIALLVLVIPIPLGSNRPVPWALWALVVSVMVAVFMLRLILREKDRKLHSLAQADLLLVAMIMPVFALIQALPVGWYIPGAFPPDMAPDTISLAPRATILATLRLLTYAGIFFLAFEIMTRQRRVRQMANILFYGLTLHAVVAMISLTVLGDRFLWGEKSTYLGWATGTFVNRNSFASFMGIGVVIGIGLFFQRRNEQTASRRGTGGGFLTQGALESAWHLMCVAMMFTALLASGSRMGLLATLFGVFVTLLMMSEGQVVRVRGLVFVAIAAVLIAGALLLQNVGERLIFAGFDIETRLSLYRNVWDLIMTRPLTGYGLDTFQIAFPLVHDDHVSAQYIWDLSHNSYLMLWSELGLIAGSAILLVFAVASIRLIRVARRGGQHPLGPAIAMGVLMLAAVHSILDFSFEMEANVILLMVTLAMGLSQIGDKMRSPR
jgi:Lipid A core - O-antigen ligase and related enzymes